jgi:hypothetical protein
MATIRAAGRKIIVAACGESMLPNMLELYFHLLDFFLG